MASRKGTNRNAPRDSAEAYAQAEQADRDYVSVLDLLDRIKALPATQPATTNA